jgi:hypothetical protein
MHAHKRFTVATNVQVYFCDIAFAEQEGPDLPEPVRDLVKQVLQPSA